jgi:hypothetical protein
MRAGERAGGDRGASGDRGRAAAAAAAAEEEEIAEKRQEETMLPASMPSYLRMTPI